MFVTQSIVTQDSNTRVAPSIASARIMVNCMHERFAWNKN